MLFLEKSLHQDLLRKSLWSEHPSVFLTDDLNIVAICFLLNPRLYCVQSCATEKILSVVSLYHMITNNILALIWCHVDTATQTHLCWGHLTSHLPKDFLNSTQMRYEETDTAVML